MRGYLIATVLPLLLAGGGPADSSLLASQPVLTQAVALCGDGETAACAIRYYGQHRYNLYFRQPPADSPWRVEVQPDSAGRLGDADEVAIDQANLQLLEDLGVDLADTRIEKTNLRSRVFSDGILASQTIEKKVLFVYHEIDGISVMDERVLITRLPTGEVERLMFAWGTAAREVLGKRDETELRASERGEIASRLAAEKFVAQLPPETVDVVTDAVWLNMGDRVAPAISITWGLGDDVDGDGVGSQAQEVFVDGVSIRDLKLDRP